MTQSWGKTDHYGLMEANATADKTQYQPRGAFQCREQMPIMTANLDISWRRDIVHTVTTSEGPKKWRPQTPCKDGGCWQVGLNSTNNMLLETSTVSSWSKYRKCALISCISEAFPLQSAHCNIKIDTHHQDVIVNSQLVLCVHTRVGRDRSQRANAFCVYIYRGICDILVGIDVHLFVTSRFWRRKVSLPYYDLCRSESISLQTLNRYDRNVVAYLLRYVRYGGGFVCVSYNRLKPAAHRRPHAFAYVNKQQTANAV
jgi:hypothetical protein